MRLLSIFASLLLVPVLAPAGHADSLDFGDIPLDRFDVSHPKVREDKHQQTRVIEILPPGQTLEAWTELLTIQAFGRKRYPPPRAAADALKQQLAGRCPDLVWNEIEATDNDILYEWRIEGCGSEPDQHEIARYLASKSTVYRISYTAKTKGLSADERREWVVRLKTAKVVR